MRATHDKIRRGPSRGIVALLVIAPLLAFVAPAGAGPDKSDVRVVNTAAEAVPVAVTGTPTVQVAGTPTVAVAGVVPVALVPPSQRWSSSASFDIGEGSGNNCNNCDDALLLDVPDGKVAVVEHVSMQMRTTPGAVFNVTLSSFGSLHYVESAYLDTDDFNRRVYAGSHPITFYAPSRPGETGELAAHTFSIGGLAVSFRTTIDVRVTGYYIDAA